MNLKLDKRFKKNVSGVFGRYRFEVGVLEDGPHYWPAYGPMSKLAKDKPPQLKSFAGGPARKVYRGSYRGKANSGTISEVSEANRARLGFNYLTEPFKKRTSDIIKFTNEFFRLVFGRSEKKRAENLLQAIVRNPILRKEYGSNSKLTRRIKGFDRYMIDTGQLFKAIKAVCHVRGSNV